MQRFHISTTRGRIEVALPVDDTLPGGQLLARALSQPGGWEQELVRMLDEVLTPGSTFVDIGAHRGLFAVLGAKLVGETGRVVACEPDPTNYGYLTQSVAANQVPWVDARQVAAGEVVGRAALYRNHDHDMCHSLAPVAGHPSNVKTRAADPADQIVEVVTTTLDAMYDEGIRPQFIKIDVEGYEPYVINGGTRMIRDGAPDVVMCEVNPWGLAQVNATGETVRAAMQRLGYAPYALSALGHLEAVDHRDRVWWDASHAGANIFFVPA